MLDARPPARPAAARRVQPLEDIEDERVRAVADRVHDGLDIVRVGINDQPLELVRIVHQQTFELPGSSRVGLEESAVLAPIEPSEKNFRPRRASQSEPGPRLDA